LGGRREEEQERSLSAGQQPAAAAILTGSAPVDGIELALVSCGTVNLEMGGSSGRFEGTEQLGKGNREKLRVAVAHLVNEQEARGTKMRRGEGGEVAGGSTDLANEWQVSVIDRNRGREKGSGRLC
jgi:hypothetical protein